MGHNATLHVLISISWYKPRRNKKASTKINVKITFFFLKKVSSEFEASVAVRARAVVGGLVGRAPWFWSIVGAAWGARRRARFRARGCGRWAWPGLVLRPRAAPLALVIRLLWVRLLLHSLPLHWTFAAWVATRVSRALGASSVAARAVPAPVGLTVGGDALLVAALIIRAWTTVSGVSGWSTDIWHISGTKLFGVVFSCSILCTNEFMPLPVFSNFQSILGWWRVRGWDDGLRLDLAFERRWHRLGLDKNRTVTTLGLRPGIWVKQKNIYH